VEKTGHEVWNFLESNLKKGNKEIVPERSVTMC